VVQDVAVANGRIIDVGRASGKAHREVDAEGMVVTPGFIDGHTHMDAQVFWDPLGTSPCWQGITSVVMGNCGFTLAPVDPARNDLVVRNLERAEDISADAMAAGIRWSWEHFSEYLDAVERLPKAINYASYIGHSALRTWAMGERAFQETASADDLETMAKELHEALRAGAVGFSTSRNQTHETADERPIASRLAEWGEIRNLASIVAEYPSRVFELSLDIEATKASGTPDQRRFFEQLRDLACDTGLCVMFGVVPSLFADDLFSLIDETRDRGGKMLGQTHSIGIWLVTSFLTQMPFDRLEVWRDIRSLPLPEQRKRLLQPEIRRRLVHAAHHGDYPRVVGAEPPKPDFETFRPLDDPIAMSPTVAELARREGVDPVEFIIDRVLASDFTQLFMQPVVPWDGSRIEAFMRHPQTVMTFSDSGAHVSQQVSPIQTFLLGHWVRERQSFSLEEAVRMITSDPARAWGFADRGLIRPGYAADLNLIDAAEVGPTLPEVAADLPGGAKRLMQRATGINMTIVGGRVVFEEGAHTGEYPGQVIRAALR
jgi:N-acyl-D-aspartate/D-glutamate deacylase